MLLKIPSMVLESEDVTEGKWASRLRCPVTLPGSRGHLGCGLERRADPQAELGQGFWKKAQGPGGSQRHLPLSPLSPLTPAPGVCPGTDTLSLVTQRSAPWTGPLQPHPAGVLEAGPGHPPSPKRTLNEGVGKGPVLRESQADGRGGGAKEADSRAGNPGRANYSQPAFSDSPGSGRPAFSRTEVPAASISQTPLRLDAAV